MCFPMGLFSYAFRKGFHKLQYVLHGFICFAWVPKVFIFRLVYGSMSYGSHQVYQFQYALWIPMLFLWVSIGIPMESNGLFVLDFNRSYVFQQVLHWISMMDSNGLLFSMSIGCLQLISIGLTLGFNMCGFQYVLLVSIGLMYFSMSYGFQQVVCNGFPSVLCNMSYGFKQVLQWMLLGFGFNRSYNGFQSV